MKTETTNISTRVQRATGKYIQEEFQGKWYVSRSANGFYFEYLHTDGIWYSSTQNPITKEWNGYFDTIEHANEVLRNANINANV